MRLLRLVFEPAATGDGEAVLQLHPRLTVVAGLEAGERQLLSTELLAALGGGRPGVRVELDGVDPEDAASTLERLGIDEATAQRVAHVTAEDLHAGEAPDDRVDVLARADQQRVWPAAEELCAAEAELARAGGVTLDDADTIQRVESGQAALEAAAERFELVRRAAFLVSGFSALLALPAIVQVGVVGFVFVAVAVLGAAASIVAWRHVQRAEQAAAEALEAAGATSYLAFNLQRVNGLLGDDADRERLIEIADRRRAAREEWDRIAPGVPAEWALAHRDEVEAAARMQRYLDALGVLSDAPPALGEGKREALVRALVRRLAEARGYRGEGVPLVLDDPLVGVDAGVKPLLLELLGRAGGEQQLIVLTSDEDVASWARLEALTGDLMLVEPVADPARPPG